MEFHSSQMQFRFGGVLDPHVHWNRRIEILDERFEDAAVLQIFEEVAHSIDVVAFVEFGVHIRREEALLAAQPRGVRAGARFRGRDVAALLGGHFYLLLWSAAAA